MPCIFFFVSHWHCKFDYLKKWLWKFNLISQNFRISKQILTACYSPVLNNSFCIAIWDNVWLTRLWFNWSFDVNSRIKIKVQTHLTFQANGINETLYCSYWYELKNPADRKRILFILMMAQKEIGFSVGGFQILRLSVYGEVRDFEVAWFLMITSWIFNIFQLLKMGFSFLTVMLNIDHWRLYTNMTPLPFLYQNVHV